ncbi:MAG TPA: tRNA (cytidine(56)-2'-O)-methyltransferase [Candidatus Thermoplasmatota archaeon]|nr:tRNA (cytidine(56)-2'-O)-methyltransferase [Candidatus Thermoplasmatota archaeon]
MSGVEITVLRLGHRPDRDKRVTTHVCLTARAFGASRVLVAEDDPHLAEGVASVADRFGGAFAVETGTGWKGPLGRFEGTKVHLTMYGLPVDEVVPKVPMDRDLLLVVGAEKVPREVYEMVDWNCAVGNQPHSEVAALAVFLYSLQGPRVLRREFQGRIRIRPSQRGKDVVGEEGST